MSNYTATADLARLHRADLHAAAEQARAGRPAAGTRRRASLWRRHRRGRAGPPALALVRAATTPAAAAPARAGQDVEAA